jgi:hypothetical protein
MSKIQEFISPNIAQNLGKEILGIVGNNLKDADTSLYQRKSLNFRDIIDNNFPTMLVVDYASIKQELKQYQDIDTALKTYISETYNPTQKDYSVNKFSDTEIDLLLKAIKYGISKFSSTTSKISYRDLQKSLSNILESDQSNNTTVARVKQLFSKIYKLTDISSSSVEVFIFPNFANLGGLLRAPLDIGLSIAEEEAGKTVESLDSIGQILAYGHTAAGYVDTQGNTILNFNSPKLLAVMFDVMSSTSDKSPVAARAALDAATFFVNDTRQTEVYLNIDKEFSEGFVKTFVSIGGNLVKFENSLVNSRRGSVLEKREKRGVNKSVLEKLAKEFAKVDSVISKRLARYVLTHKKSPNIIEYSKHIILSSIKGESVQKYKSKSKQTTTSKDTISKQAISGIVKGKAKLPSLPKPKTQPPKASAVNLLKLTTLINSQLQDVISANMGDGDSRNVLNYRTGRFASTVKVENLSSSREGMITAFYSYMKNPYATFSTGGRQSTPKSRDPKLLISKSIREIAQQIVTNKLRAVAL